MFASLRGEEQQTTNDHRDEKREADRGGEEEEQRGDRYRGSNEAEDCERGQD